MARQAQVVAKSRSEKLKKVQARRGGKGTRNSKEAQSIGSGRETDEEGEVEESRVPPNGSMPSSLSTAELYNFVVNRPPGPMSIVSREDDGATVDRRIKEDSDPTTTLPGPTTEDYGSAWERVTAGPWRPRTVVNINEPTSSEALVGPPGSVTVQALSNSSAVIQWEFDDAQQAEGFTIKYMHEPGSGKDLEQWTSTTVLGSKVRHAILTDLTAHRPYAFCVLALKQNRQGSCSDPPTTIEKLEPLYMVSDLEVVWKTSNSVSIRWEYKGPKPVKFFVNHTGRKMYMDQTLQNKSLQSPGFRIEVEGNKREYFLSSLRPNMQYALQVGVTQLGSGRSREFDYWPAEISIKTDPTGPPVVTAPHITASGRVLAPGQVAVRLSPATEESGPISHYWIIVVPGNYTDGFPALDGATLERETNARKAQLSSSLTIQPAKKLKKRQRGEDGGREEEDEGRSAKRLRREVEVDSSLEPVILPDTNEISASSSYSAISDEDETEKAMTKRKRSLPAVHGAYIAARIDSDEMHAIYNERDATFIIGNHTRQDHGFVNYPLEHDKSYRVMMRAFAKADTSKRNEFDQRPPMSERGTKLYTDSPLSESFSPRTAGGGGRGNMGTNSSQLWMFGPLISLLVVAVIVGSLVCWWMRCNKKSAGRNSMRHHGSITKVALGGHPINGSGLNGETAKLLASGSSEYGRAPIMNPYEGMNGNNSTSLDHLYPLPISHSRPFNNGNISGYPTLNTHLPSSGGIIGGQTLSHPPVPITELQAHIDRLRSNNNRGFVDEFESIETGQQFTWEHSQADYNKHKNRYANVVAYDHSRVILSSLDGMPGTDYINANYIDGYDRPRAYIATQGPLPETFDDFWRMVWEEGSTTIVMLTNLEEQNRIKCDQYWPSRGTASYGEVEVSLESTTVLAHYTMRIMKLSMLGEDGFRTITHLQYTAWPDHGVPDHPTPFLVFLKRVKTLNPPDAGPIVSHCSAGIGRTGAFIVIDCMLERLRYEHTVDIFGCVTALRAQRSYMVQIDDQYMFIHDAVLDAVLSGSTEVPEKRLHSHISALMAVSHEGMSPLEQEFRQLNTFPRGVLPRSVDANLPVNRHKNRAMNVVPFDHNRVVLSAIPQIEGSDYINASWVDGYKERYAYIATQAPLESTITDFWRMIWEHECGIIVVLKMGYDGTTGREHSASRMEYWPQEQGVQCGQLVVEPIAEYNMPEYILREFKLSDLQSNMSRTVRHFEYIDWSEMNPAPKQADYFIDFIQQVHRTKTQFGVDGPIVVHCGTGAGRTGVFLALAQIIDRIRLERVIDVFTTVKLLRTERQGMVTEREQYQFLYLAAREFLSSLDHPM